jgi:hypothetical protein
MVKQRDYGHQHQHVACADETSWAGASQCHFHRPDPAESCQIGRVDRWVVLGGRTSSAAVSSGSCVMNCRTELTLIASGQPWSSRASIGASGSTASSVWSVLSPAYLV